MNTPSTASAPGRDTARIHLRVLQEDHTIPVEAATGPRTLADLLPPARTLADQATTLILDRFRAAGHPPRCRAGCAACCRPVVAISLVEALDLSDLLASLPPERQATIRARFAAILRRLEQAGFLEPVVPGQARALLIEEGEDFRDLSLRYFRLGLACPFLEAESCSIYERRPTVCREHHVVSPPENCSRPEEGEVDRVEVRLNMTGALARTVGHYLEQSPRTIPLVLALEWAERDGKRLRQTHDGVEMLQTLIGAIDPAFGKPFEERETED
jgi:Fe-S-cluster containining protein